MIQFTSFQLLEALGCPEKMGIIRHSKKEVTKALARTEKKGNHSWALYTANPSSNYERAATYPVGFNNNIVAISSRAKIHISQCHQITLKKYYF